VGVSGIVFLPADAITHLKPLVDFLHWYLTFFAVRKVPAFTHFDPTICVAALETEETLIRKNTKTQSPTDNPRCLFTA
jgi:hypothetical protein